MFTNGIVRVFIGGQTSDKMRVLNNLRQKKEEVRMARTSIMSVLKDKFAQESNLAVKEELLNTIVELDDVAAVRAFLDAIIDAKKGSLFIRQRARALKTLVDLGVFDKDDATTIEAAEP